MTYLKSIVFVFILWTLAFHILPQIQGGAVKIENRAHGR